MPFITEEIHGKLRSIAGATDGAALLMTQAWPDTGAWPADAQADAEVRWIQGIVLGLRQIRGEMDISPARALPVLVSQATDDDRRLIARHAAYVSRLANLESLRELAAGESAPPAAMALSGELQLRVPMAGLIDPAAEAERLNKKVAKLQGELTKARGKLANEQFVRNAPAEVVAQERDRIADFERAVQSLGQQLAAVRQLLAER
jgi:valyl-tRNA synthetase